MMAPENWRKSTYSDGGDGNECVEIATTPSHTAVRDTKDPAGGILTFPAGAFAAFLDGVKGGTGLTGSRD